MNKTTVTALVVAAAALLSGLALVLGTSSGEQSSASATKDAPTPSASEEFDRAPSFALEDYDGNTVRSSDFEGKVLVLNSWATWCPFCVDELPDFGRLQEAFPEEIVVISIDRAESRERAKQFTDELEVTDQLVFLLDPKDSFYRAIGGFSMPETLFVDTEGNIRIHKRGPMEFEEMKEKVEHVLSAEGG